MKSKVILSVFIFSCLVSTQSMLRIEAQSPISLSYGDSVSGEITSAKTEIEYEFEGNANDTVSIIVSAEDSSTLDLEVTLLDSDENELAYNDDADGVNPAITEQILNTDGTYTVLVSAVDGEGNFTLELIGEEGSGHKILYSDDFSDNDADWETANDPTLAVTLIENGVMHIEYTPFTPGSGWVVAPGFTDRSKAPIFSDDFVIEVEFSNFKSSNNNGMVGVMFYEQDQYQGFYQFTISTNGIWTYTINNTEGYSTPQYILVEEFDLTKGTHILQVIVHNNEYSFIVDDVFIGTQIEANPLFDDGTIGLAAYSFLGEIATIEIDFDNLVVYELDQETLALIENAPPTCIIDGTFSKVNLREGPGTEFAVAGQLSFIVKIIGQAKATNGKTWWKLANGLWVSKEVLVGPAECNQVPEVSQ